MISFQKDVVVQLVGRLCSVSFIKGGITGGTVKVISDSGEPSEFAGESYWCGQGFQA